MDESTDTLEQQFDLSNFPTTKNIVGLYQSGDFLVATTDSGMTFRHRIPANKILNKNDKGDWILEDVDIRH